MRLQDRWMYRIPRDSKASDKRRRRQFKVEDFITTTVLEQLQTRQRNRCWYCDEFMDWLERRSTKTGLTVERKDTNLAHVVDNCVLCCKSCNSRKYSREKGLLKRYFSKWYNKTFEIRQPMTNRRCSFVT